MQTIVAEGESALEHFEIIQALCRSALADPSPAFRRQVERLREALAAAGQSTEAATLSRLLNSVERRGELRPSRLRRSAIIAPGEAITANTPLPVDRETAAPLAQVIPVNDLPDEPPIFGPQLTAGVSSLLGHWEHIDLLTGHGVAPPRTCLLYGAPGTGKTELALWIGRQLQLPVVLARLDGLISSFLGTTARNIGVLFAYAVRYKCLLLLDEFDAIAKLRDDPQEVGEIKRVVNTLLQNLDQRSSIGLTIAITNHEGLLDPAVWRRFEMQVAVPRPAEPERRAIIIRYFEPTRLTETEQTFLSWLTDGHTGAELETLVLGIRRMLAMSLIDAPMQIPTDIPHDFALVNAVRQYYSLNAGRLTAERFAILNDDEVLMDELARCTDMKLQSIGDLLGVSGSTVSRKRHKIREAIRA
ncbi:MAG: AAA family ATPase [Vulcanimicrobiaceae bacterium]